MICGYFGPCLSVLEDPPESAVFAAQLPGFKQWIGHSTARMWGPSRHSESGLSTCTRPRSGAGWLRRSGSDAGEDIHSGGRGFVMIVYFEPNGFHVERSAVIHRLLLQLRAGRGGWELSTMPCG